MPSQSGFIIRTLTKTTPGAPWDVARELRQRFLLALHAADIKIPYPQRVVHHRGEVVAGRPESGD